MCQCVYRFYVAWKLKYHGDVPAYSVVSHTGGGLNTDQIIAIQFQYSGGLYCLSRKNLTILIGPILAGDMAPNAAEGAGISPTK
jgi:hypothetical protein